VKNLKITVITGLSGSGKSTAIAAFEDAGYYCVDNLPVELLPKLVELPIENNSEFAGFAFVMDLREKGFLSKYRFVFDALRKNGYRFNVLFLEADPDILIARYSATRRQHPLSRDKSLPEAIQLEISQLKNLRDEADAVIDTSRCNVHELKSLILDRARQNQKDALMQIHVMSFGFKNGIPLNADLVVDVRFLVNPYFDPALKDLNGESKPIRDFILKNRETGTFLAKYCDLLDYLLPQYEKEGKAYLTIAVGCTGGQHRSVTIARSIAGHIEKSGKPVTLIHRDI
jgi:RNase adapter protein RapZ